MYQVSSSTCSVWYSLTVAAEKGVLRRECFFKKSIYHLAASLTKRKYLHFCVLHVDYFIIKRKKRSYLHFDVNKSENKSIILLLLLIKKRTCIFEDAGSYISNLSLNSHHYRCFFLQYAVLENVFTGNYSALTSLQTSDLL